MNNWEWPLIACWAFAGLACVFMLLANRHANRAAATLAAAKKLVASLWNQSEGGR